MPALPVIAVAATVASTAASVVGQVSQAKAQKKAAQSQAEIDQANAELAELNAEAQAVGIEKQTEFNLKEIGIDKEVLKGKETRELEGMLKIGGFQNTQYDLDLQRLNFDADNQSKIAQAETDAKRSDLQGHLADLVAKGEYERAVIAARGSSELGDIIDEISLLDGDAAYREDDRRREAVETLRRAGAAIVSITARNAYEQASLSRAAEADLAETGNKTGSLAIQRGEALDQADDAGRALMRNEAARALEQQQLARRRDRVMGAARAQAAKSGLALDGSAIDMMMDLGLDATGEMVRADLAAAQRTDNLSAEMRGRSVQADLYNREAHNLIEQSSYRQAQLMDDKAYKGEEAMRAAAEVQASADFDAGRLRAEADHIRTQANRQIVTLQRHAEETKTAMTRDLNYSRDQSNRDQTTTQRHINETDAAGTRTKEYIDNRVLVDRKGLANEREYAAWQLSEQEKELRISTEQQVAALDREFDMMKWRGETEAQNMRNYGSAQAQVLRQSAAATLSAGKSAYSTAMFGAGATLLRGGYNAYDIYSGGALTGLTQPKTGGTITTVRP